MPKRNGSAAEINWSEIHAGLECAARVVREALEPPPERAKAIMDERARNLARVAAHVPSSAEVFELVIFIMGEECYALETQYIRRVARLERVTHVPGTSEVLLGLVNAGGEIIPIFDLRALFGLAKHDPTDSTRVLILGIERDEFGILADEAHEVATLRRDAVLAPAASLEESGRNTLRGVTEGAVVVLDGAALLRDERLFIDQGVDPGS